MIGAIIGDIVGSRFEFDNIKTKNFELFDSECDFTDDTVMTLAVAKSFVGYDFKNDIESFKNHLVKNMHNIGCEYPNCGYGGRFLDWIIHKHTTPYYSCGNGSAMRVSSVGWVAKSLIEAEELAKTTAEVTHNHPEGIKGAEATASCIFLARMGARKEELKRYVEKEFEYNLNRTLEEIRPTFHMDESCQGTIPEAIIAFLESTDFEDAIRNTVSLGGDTDTLAAITGSIAEAYYGIPSSLKIECRNRVDKDILEVMELFDELLKDETWS